MLRHGPHIRRHEPIRLPALQEWSIYIVIGLLALSGVAWLLLHYFGAVQTEFGSQPHPWNYQMLRLHGAFAILSLVALGSLIPIHIRRAWELGKNRVTGVTLIGAICVLVVTGYLLYYFAGESSRAWISFIHWGVGLALLPGLAVHVWTGQLRQRMAARNEQAADAPVA